jgi:thiol-disulfide isomerase/thioredoxin
MSSLPGEARPSASLRRRLLFAGAGLAAAAAGAGFAWHRLRLEPTVGDDGLEALWGMSFDTPQGAPLAMRSLRGRPLLINFWATWCPPCVEELPLIDDFYRTHSPRNWQVLALAVDQPSAVRQFLARGPVSFPVGMAGLAGTELSRSLGNLSGGLPFTVVLGPDGEVRQRKMGRLTAADLAQWAGAA